MSRLRYFKLSEFKCSHTGKVDMDKEFLRKLDELRHRAGFPIIVNSGYRDASHPIEAAKSRPGSHAQGIAADLHCINPSKKHILLKLAFELGFTGIGIADTFIHVDTRDTIPVVWVYD